MAWAALIARSSGSTMSARSLSPVTGYGHGGQRPKTDKGVGRGSAAPFAHDVQHDGADPRPDGQVGEHGMGPSHVPLRRSLTRPGRTRLAKVRVAFWPSLFSTSRCSIHWTADSLHI
jgi:hypothetical protein